LPLSYRFLVHIGFQEQVQEFLRRKAGWEKRLRKQFEKARADPFGAGSLMSHIPVEELQGKILKLWVGGRRGHRLVYVVIKSIGIVFPAWISLVPRSRIDYEREPWLEYALRYFHDLQSGDMDKFKEWIF